MSQFNYVSDQGQAVTVEEKLATIPYGWAGQIEVSGVEERDGYVFGSNTPTFYGTYWVLQDGTEMWLEDFLDASMANAFADEVKQAALMNVQSRH